MRTIDHDIPIPPRSRGIFTGLQETMSIMSIGDSFVYDLDVAKNTYFYVAAKTVGVKITIRKLAKGGFRIWRVA